MTLSDAYTLDTELLKSKSVSELCDVIDQLLVIIKDLARTIDLQNGIIDILEDDGK